MLRLMLCGVVSWLALSSAPLRADEADDKAAALVTKLKGQVTRDERAPGRPIIAVTLIHPQVTAAQLKELAACEKLASLIINSQIADADLKELAAFKSLTRLDLSQTKVTDEGLKALAPLKNLTALNLDCPRVTADGLKALAPLKNLNELTLRREHLTDQTVDLLRELKILHALSQATTAPWYGVWSARARAQFFGALAAPAPRKGRRPLGPEDVVILNLHGTELTDNGLEGFAAFKNLTVLILGSRTTDQGLKALAGFKSLTRLDLFGTKVTNAGMKELAALPGLTSLHLFSTRVSHEGLKELAPLKKLTEINVMHHQLTDQSLAVLRELNLLHTLPIARSPDGVQPAKAADVVQFNLGGTKVTGEGLKELAPLKNLTNLGLTPFQLDDEALAALRSANLLHTLGQAKGAKGKRPTKPEEIILLNLGLSKVSDTGLKELTGLENLAELNLVNSKVTKAGVKELQKALPNCKIQQ